MKAESPKIRFMVVSGPKVGVEGGVRGFGAVGDVGIEVDGERKVGVEVIVPAKCK